MAVYRGSSALSSYRPAFEEGGWKNNWLSREMFAIVFRGIC
jgi:hypothetical protein